jgi:hypothetical protein
LTPPQTKALWGDPDRVQELKGGMEMDRRESSGFAETERVKLSDRIRMSVAIAFRKTQDKRG